MPLTRTSIHQITTVHGQARADSRSVAACPRRRESVEIEECLSCPHLKSFGAGDAVTGPTLLCVTDTEESASSEPGTVGSFMGRDVVCVRPDVTIETVAAMFLQRRFSGLPVVDADGHPIGVVAKTDVVRAFSQGRLHDDIDTLDPTAASRAPAKTAGDIMTPDGLTLRESEPVARAAELFSQHGVHRAPVVSAEGRLVGILTSFDLLRALAKPNTELDEAR